MVSKIGLVDFLLGADNISAVFFICFILSDEYCEDIFEFLFISKSDEKFSFINFWFVPYA